MTPPIFKKIGIIVAIVVIILIGIWLIKLWYSLEKQKKELEEKKEILISEEEFYYEVLPENFFEENFYQDWPQEEKLPSPAELFPGPELSPE